MIRFRVPARYPSFALESRCTIDRGTGGLSQPCCREWTLARISRCAVERRAFLVSANLTQQLSLSVGSSRGGTWR